MRKKESKTLTFCLGLIMLLLAACGGGPTAEPTEIAQEPADLPVPPTDTAVPPADTPNPTTDAPISPTDTRIPPSATPAATTVPLLTPSPSGTSLPEGWIAYENSEGGYSFAHPGNRNSHSEIGGSVTFDVPSYNLSRAELRPTHYCALSRDWEPTELFDCLVRWLFLPVPGEFSLVSTAVWERGKQPAYVVEGTVYDAADDHTLYYVEVNSPVPRRQYRDLRVLYINTGSPVLTEQERSLVQAVVSSIRFRKR